MDFKTVQGVWGTKLHKAVFDSIYYWPCRAVLSQLTSSVSGPRYVTFPRDVMIQSTPVGEQLRCLCTVGDWLYSASYRPHNTVEVSSGNFSITMVSVYLGEISFNSR